jgi:hypothetical protein
LLAAHLGHNFADMENRMFDQMLDGFRKATESSLQFHQEVFKQLTQQLLSAQPNMGGASADWTRPIQKRWMELTIEMLNKHRTSLDAMYSSGIQAIEQSFRITEAKSSDDYRRIVDELWHRLFDTLKGQMENQFRDFQRWSEQSFDIAQKAQSQTQPHA